MIVLPVASASAITPLENAARISATSTSEQPRAIESGVTELGPRSSRISR